MYIISASDDFKYIEGWLKTNVLTSDEKLEMLVETRNREYMLKAINNSDYKLEDRHRLILAQMLKNAKIKAELSKRYEPECIQNKIELPFSMTVGIEIESEGYFALNFLGEIWEGWKAEKEATNVADGLEVKSPKLKSTEEDSKSIYKMCNTLIDIGQEVSEQWGGHIHIGADFLTGTDSYVNLLKMWCVSEKILYLISNQENEITRESAIIGDEYAKPISKKIKQAIENGTINLDTEQDLEDFIEQLKEVQELEEGDDRYFSINFLNIGKENKNTIEFRLPNATLSPKIWIENINLFGGIVKAAEEIAIVQRKPEIERTEEEKEKLQLFEKLISGRLEEREILDILLTLTVKADKKQIYVSRYESNKKLMKKHPNLKKILDEEIEF